MSRRYLSPTRRAYLSDLADEIANEHFPDAVVDPRRIIEAEGITSSYNDYGNYFDGMLECRDGRFHIFCNTSRSSGPNTPRARFTLAHELGHYFIDEHRHSLLAGRGEHFSKSEFESSNLIEQEADTFASSLLLPPTRFRQAAKKSRRGLRAVVGLSDSFGTSLTATAIRYVQENLYMCALIKWSPSEYSWKWLSHEARKRGYKKTIEAMGDIPEGSATARALAGEEAPAGGHFESGSTASFWFPFVSAGAEDDILLIEQSIPLGRFGALTFLYPAAP